MSYRLQVSCVGVALALLISCGPKDLIIQVENRSCPPRKPKVYKEPLPQKPSSPREFEVVWDKVEDIDKLRLKSLDNWDKSFDKCVELIEEGNKK